MNILVAIVGAAVFLCLCCLPYFRRNEAWSATVTPLASIMGSGFLISAPLLASIVGHYSPWVMACLLLLAWAIGGAIRFNIANLSRSSNESAETSSSEDAEKEPKPLLDHRLHLSHADGILSWIWKEAVEVLPIDAAASEQTSTVRVFSWINLLEKVSQFVLAIAYVITVTYYVRLLGSFLFKALDVSAGGMETLVAAIILGGIAITGYFFGLRIIETVEKYAINLNLSVILALLASLAVYNFQLWNAGDWSLPDLHVKVNDWDAFRSCLGLLVIVQGFETSRFLGAEHSAELRIRTMRRAQAIACCIYLAFLALMAVVVTPKAASQDVDVTAIIGLVGIVATALPWLVTVAALGSQFSAAVADEAGCGGLLSQLLGSRLNDRTAYLLIGGVTVTLACFVNVLEIISFASRAFALYYCLQCAVACVHAWKNSDHSKLQAAWYGLLTLLALIVTVLAKSVEG